MVEASYGRRTVCFWIPIDRAVIVVIIAFISIPNYGIKAKSNNDYKNQNPSKIALDIQRNTKGRFKDKTEVEDLFSPYNPPWKEEQVCTFEKRGPIFSSNNHDTVSLRTPRRMGGRHSLASPPLEPREGDIDDTSSTIMNTERYRQRKQRRQQSVHFHLKDDEIIQCSYFDFPLQSADIGSIGSRNNDIQSGSNQKTRVNRERGRKDWLFPIDFRREKGRLNVSFSIAGDARKQRKNRRPHYSGARNLGSLTTYDDESKATTTAAERSIAKTIKNIFASGGVKQIEHERENSSNQTDVSASTRRQSSSQIVNKSYKSNPRASISLDPFSMGTSVQNGATTIVGIASAYIETLKLLGPMILASQCLMAVGRIFNDQYNRRYVQNASIKSKRYLEKSCLDDHDSIAATRAVARSVLQILCMSCTGRFVGFVLDRSPCLLRPSWICQWWYGVVWLASVYGIGLACQNRLFSYLSQTDNKIRSFVSIQPISSPEYFGSQDNRVYAQARRRNTIQSFFQSLQRMSRDPRERSNNPLHVIPRMPGRNNHNRYRKTMVEGEGVSKIKLDPRFFPSTWKPLAIVTYLAFSAAIFKSFCTEASSLGLIDKLSEAACMKNNQHIIMRSFIIQQTLYHEWYRVLIQEQRVALGANVSVIGLLALMWSIYSVSTVDRIATMVMVPILMTRVVSSWTNILLKYNRFSVPADTMTWGT